MKLGKSINWIFLQAVLLLIAGIAIFVFTSSYVNPMAIVVWEYQGPPYFDSPLMGDADRLPNGNTLITIPAISNKTTSQMPRIIEVAMDEEKVWEVIFGNVSFSKAACVPYRSERILNLDLNSSILYNPDGYPTSFTINVTVWNQQKASNGITFVALNGDVWGINMTGHVIWKYSGDWYEQKLLPNNHLLLVRGWCIREIDFNGTVFFDIVGNIHHDAIKLDDYNIMYLSTVLKDINGIIYRGDEILQMNLETKQIVWRWNTFDYLPITDNCPLDIFRGDWTHSNSLTAILEGNRSVVYLSVRNLNQIVKIDYETKQIIWKLGENGDFRMFEKNGTKVTKLFSHQHDPEILPNGNILLFDNGCHWDEEHQPYNRASRVIEIQITGSGMHSRPIPDSLSAYFFASVPTWIRRDCREWVISKKIAFSKLNPKETP